MLMVTNGNICVRTMDGSVHRLDNSINQCCHMSFKIIFLAAG